jgi:hypothetical protein
MCVFLGEHLSVNWSVGANLVARAATTSAPPLKTSYTILVQIAVDCKVRHVAHAHGNTSGSY